MRLLICLNENEKRQWRLIYFINKYSEEDCSSRGELTDVIKYAAVPFAELPDLRRSIHVIHTPESNSRSPKYRGCKSEICVLGIEKRTQT